MTREEALDRMLAEIQTKGIQCIQNYIPTSDHYIPLRLLSYYLYLAYGIGFDEGTKQLSHGKPVIQMSNGEIVKIWPSQWDAEKFFKLSKGAIGKALTAKTKAGKKIKVKGFEWERG